MSTDSTAPRFDSCSVGSEERSLVAQISAPMPSLTDSTSASTPRANGTLRHLSSGGRPCTVVVIEPSSQRTAAAHADPVRIITPSTSA